MPQQVLNIPRVDALVKQIRSHGEPRTPRAYAVRVFSLAIWPAKKSCQTVSATRPDRLTSTGKRPSSVLDTTERRSDMTGRPFPIGLPCRAHECPITSFMLHRIDWPLSPVNRTCAAGFLPYVCERIIFSFSMSWTATSDVFRILPVLTSGPPAEHASAGFPAGAGLGQARRLRRPVAGSGPYFHPRFA